MHPEINRLLVLLSRNIGQRKLYFSGHQIIRNACDVFAADLRKLLAELEIDRLFIGIVEDKLIYDGHYLVGPSIMGRQLVEFGRMLQCGGFIFKEDTTSEEIQVLLDFSNEFEHPISTLREARELLRSRDVVNIELASDYIAPSSLTPLEDQIVWQGLQSGGHLHSPLIVYQALFDVVAKTHGNISLDRSIDLEGAGAVSAHLLYSLRHNFTDMLQFVHYPDHDSYTVGHSVRVATLAVHIGENLGLDEELLLEFGTAALLHDVGKSKIPSEILFKPGLLTHEEFAEVQFHSRMGAEILLEQEGVTPMQVAAAWGHHLRHDGGGYPESPPWAVRGHLISLLQICDVFEALTAARPYKAPVTPLSAFGIMLADKGRFDPALLSTFISILGIYPPGNRVHLLDGSLATVISATSSVDKPLVRITHDQTGRKLDTTEQHLVDLEQDRSGKRAVAELLIGEK